MINIKNLQKTFGKNEVLKGIDLEIEAGEVVVIIGPSGSGKSTFLRCLNLLETPTGGSVEFEGKNLLDKNTNIDQLRQKMGMVLILAPPSSLTFVEDDLWRHHHLPQ